MARTPQHSADTARSSGGSPSPSVIGGRDTEDRLAAGAGEPERSGHPANGAAAAGLPGEALPGEGSAGLLAAAEPRPGESLAELTRRLLEHVDSLDDVEPGSSGAGPLGETPVGSNGAAANGAVSHGAAPNGTTTNSTTDGNGRHASLLSRGVPEESTGLDAVSPEAAGTDQPVAGAVDGAVTETAPAGEVPSDAAGVTHDDATSPAAAPHDEARHDEAGDVAAHGDATGHDADPVAGPDVTPPADAAADAPVDGHVPADGHDADSPDVGDTPAAATQDVPAEDLRHGAAHTPAAERTDARESDPPESFGRTVDPLSGGITPLLAGTPATPRRRVPDPLSDPFPADVLGTGVFGMEAFEADPPEQVEPEPEPAPEPEPLLTTPGGGTRTRHREISAANLLPEEAPAPRSGWRRAVYRMTNGAVNPGLSARDQERAEWTERIRSPLAGCHRVAVVSLKGGVGKTTTTVGLGATLASLRGDRVIAVDASPDRGTLGVKVPRTNQLTVRQLLDSRGDIQRYVDVRRFVSQADSRLEVLASDEDPEVSQAFSDEDYRNVDEILERYYSIIVTDCGPGMLHSAMHAVLSLTDTLVVVSTASVDGASSADATLDWLNAHGYADLARNCVTVISTSFAIGPQVDVDMLEKHFASRTREVVRVPYDTHLAGGGFVDLPRLHPTTSDAYLRIAASVVDRFATGG